MTTLKVWALTQTCSTPGTRPPPAKGTSRIHLLIRPELLSLAQDPPAAEHEPGTGSVQLLGSTAQILFMIVPAPPSQIALPALFKQFLQGYVGPEAVT